MTRLLVVALMGLSLAACSSDDDRYDHSHGSRPRRDVCSQQVTCGTCTPVLGCGWCQFEDGGGRCASGPSACGETFRWNWEPEACPVEPKVDAGASDAPIASDAAAETADADAADETSTDAATDAESDAPVDAAEEAAVDAPAADAAAEAAACVTKPIPSGCVQSFGGTLCGTGKYTLGCSGAVPAACTAALNEGGTTHYCCPCN